MKKLVAAFVTLAAIAMTSSAALDQGGTISDKVILVSIFIVIVLGVHLLPAFSNRPVKWIFWSGCLVCAIYGHLTFWTNVHVRAGESLAQTSVLVVGTNQQSQEVQKQIDEIHARPIAELAPLYSLATHKRERDALQFEIDQGIRKQRLQDKLLTLSDKSTVAQGGSIDSVTANLVGATGWTKESLSIAQGLVFSLTVELAGMFFWLEALKPLAEKSVEVAGSVAAVTAPAIKPVSPVTLPVTKPVTPAKSMAVTHVTPSVTFDVTRPVTRVTPDVTPDVTQSVTQEIVDVTLPVTEPVTQSVTVENVEAVTLITETEIAPEISSELNDYTARKLAVRAAIEEGKCAATNKSVQAFFGGAGTINAQILRELKQEKEVELV